MLYFTFKRYSANQPAKAVLLKQEYASKNIDLASRDFGEEWISFARDKNFCLVIKNCMHEYIKTFLGRDLKNFNIRRGSLEKDNEVICIESEGYQWGEMYISRAGLVIKGEPMEFISVCDTNTMELAW